MAVCPFSSRARDDASTNISGPHLPVLIVGAGPVGLVLSLLLTKFGTSFPQFQLFASLLQGEKNANGLGLGLGFAPVGICLDLNGLSAALFATVPQRPVPD